MTIVVLPTEPFTLADLARLELSAADLRRALEHGRVRRVLRGVYVSNEVGDSIELRTAALHLVVGPAHVIVDRTAAWLHGIDSFAATELDAGAPIEVCALRGHTRSRLSGARGRTRDLHPDDVMEIDGLRVTTPLRTALDLGCHLRRREAFAALCNIARQHAVGVPELVRGAERFGRRRGVRQLRELAPLVLPMAESAREAWTLLAIHDAGLPLPEAQVWIDADVGRRFRLDFAYPQQRVCVEYDGIEFHDTTDEQRRYDRERRQWLRDRGWTIIVVRLGDFTGEGLDRWLRELRSALASSYSTRRW